MIHITSAQYVTDFIIWVSFDDGTFGGIDLKGVLQGRIFEPLKNPEAFSGFSVDPELRTITWPNGADLAPEFLKALLNSDQK